MFDQFNNNNNNNNGIASCREIQSIKLYILFRFQFSSNSLAIIYFIPIELHNWFYRNERREISITSIKIIFVRLK